MSRNLSNPISMSSGNIIFRVLIVDESYFYHVQTTLAIKKFFPNAEIFNAFNWAHAAEIYDQHQPIDLIVSALDLINLDECMQGLEFLKEVKGKNKNVVSVLYTTCIDPVGKSKRNQFHVRFILKSGVTLLRDALHIIVRDWLQ